MSRPAAALVALWLAATPALAPAQTIEERAARVREEMSTPPSVETVIDRGTRVLGAPPTAATTTTPSSPGIDARLGAQGVQTAPDFNERMNRLLIRDLPAAQIPGTGAPPGTAFVDDARGAGRSGPLPDQGRLWIKDYAPGKLVTRAGTDGQVTGTSNLITGSGVPAGPVTP